MKWLYVTVGLLATSVCLVGWIYLRDRNTSSYLPPPLTERQLAQIDASATLNHLAGADCHPDCTAQNCWAAPKPNTGWYASPSKATHDAYRSTSTRSESVPNTT
jgi:hypothetical protein